MKKVKIEKKKDVTVIFESDESKVIIEFFSNGTETEMKIKLEPEIDLSSDAITSDPSHLYALMFLDKIKEELYSNN